jgi:hypothetical protein
MFPGANKGNAVEATRSRTGQVILSGLLLTAAAALLMIFFEKLPIAGTSLAIDWQQIWTVLRGGRLQYADTLVPYPPWGLGPLLPLGFLSMQAGWGAFALLTLLALVASIPAMEQRWKRLLALILLVTSYSTLRILADGNLEGWVIAGTLLMLWAVEKRRPALLGVALVIVTAKPQEMWLTLIFLMVVLVRTWRPREWLLAGGVALALAAPFALWRGPDWWHNLVTMPQAGSIMDNSLPAALARLGFPLWLRITALATVAALTLLVALKSQPTFTRDKAAMLIAASVLVSPYGAANSYLNVLALGVIPLLEHAPLAFALLLALLNQLYFWPGALAFNWSANFFAGLFLLTWAVLAAHITRKEIRGFSRTQE